MTLPIQQDHAPAAPAPDRPRPTLTTEDAEKFWTEGHDARAGQEGIPCCVGVDTPGVGYAHAPGCAVAEDARDRLLCQLLFAAQDLAQAQIFPLPLQVVGARGYSEPPLMFCMQCLQVAVADTSVIAHRPGCKTGRVLRVLADLVQAGKKTIRKEAVTDGEAGRAGDGIRSLDVPLMAVTGPAWRQGLDTLGAIAFYDKDAILIRRVVVSTDPGTAVRP